MAYETPREDNADRGLGLGPEATLDIHALSCWPKASACSVQRRHVTMTGKIASTILCKKRIFGADHACLRQPVRKGPFVRQVVFAKIE
jgi:hypothetical protein